MNREQLIQLVSAKLNRIRHHGVALRIVEDGVREDNGWWFVPVLASGDNPPPIDFLYPEYATIESDIADEFQVDVMLVPTAA